MCWGTSSKHTIPTQAFDEMLEISKRDRILGRGLRKDRKLPLRALREAAGTTQEAVASATGMDQSEISRVEQRDDLRLTLRRYAKALNAEPRSSRFCRPALASSSTF